MFCLKVYTIYGQPEDKTVNTRSCCLLKYIKLVFLTATSLGEELHQKNTCLVIAGIFGYIESVTIVRQNN